MDLSNENIIHIKDKGIEYLQFRRLNKYPLKHAFVVGLDKCFRTSRANDKKITKEEYELTVNSYKTLCEALDINYDNIVKSNQVHMSNIEIVRGKKNESKPDFGEYPNTDGLVTDKKDIILSTTSADCILLLFYDPIKKVIANVHSGWKGTLQHISVKAVQLMKNEYGCNFNDIICAICPSIRKCHFEVNKDVYEMFYNEFSKLKEWDNVIEYKNPKWNIDTVMLNKILLKDVGIREENIIDSGICSMCNKNIIHSYRAEGADYGLSTAVISLN